MPLVGAAGLSRSGASINAEQHEALNDTGFFESPVGLTYIGYSLLRNLAQMETSKMQVQQYSTRAARRITWTLFVAQGLASAALIANGTVNPIIGAELSGREALAGLPGTLLLLGAAATAQP